MAKSLIGKIMGLSHPIPLGPSNRFGQSSSLFGSGMTSQLQTMGAQGTLFAIVQLLSTGMMSHEWQMFRKNTDARRRYSGTDVGSDQRTEVLQHQALNLWKRPNDFMTGDMFVEIGWQFMELVGEWYWVLNRGASGLGVPLEIWPVRPDRMEPVPDKEKFLKGWVYTGPDGQAVPLSTDEVIQIKYPNPTDPYRGMSAVQSIMADIDSARYSSEWSRNFFLNSATPGGIVQFAKRLSDDEFDEFTERWREGHQGVARGHRVGILEQGAQWIPNTYTMRDMEFPELRRMDREVIREAYRIHQAMLGNSDDVNRANAQTAKEIHVDSHEVPRLGRMKTVLNEFYLPMFGGTGSGVEFDFKDPTPVSADANNKELSTKSTSAATLVKAGYDPTEVLVVVGLPDMKFKPPPEPKPPALPAHPDQLALPPGKPPATPGITIGKPGAVPPPPQDDAGGERLKEYWTHGEGAAKIRWGEPGDFKRCVRHLEKYVMDPEGYCNEMHHRALGVYPGQEHAQADTDIPGYLPMPKAGAAEDYLIRQIQEGLLEAREDIEAEAAANVLRAGLNGHRERVP